MIVTACLAWYMEPPEFLDRCVRSLAPFCDRLVALDGPWDLFPATAEASTVEEVDAIAAAAYETGLDLTVGQGRYSTQVAKRDALMRLAGRGADWLLVIDGDEHLEVPLPEIARGALEATRNDVGEVLLRPMNRGWPLREMPANVVPIRRLYRAGVRCPGPAHHVYEFDGRFLEGDTMYIRREPAADFSELVTVHHDNQNRGRLRDDAAKRYRRDRGRARVEAWT